MATGWIDIVYILFGISLVCYIFTALVLLRSKANPLILMHCVGGIILCSGCLLSTVFGMSEEIERANSSHYTQPPSVLCFLQGLIIQYSACLVIITASCFAYQTYRLLIRCTANEVYNSRLMKWYYCLIFAYPTVMIVPLATLSAKNNAIQPREIICDVDNPAYLRLLGYAGCNLIMCIPGVYFSGCAALAVVRHLEQFKSSSTLSGLDEFDSTVCNSVQFPRPCLSRDSSRHYQEIPGTTTVVDKLPQHQPSPKGSESSSKSLRNIFSHMIGQRDPPEFKLHINSRSYNLTRAAAIRMTAFCILFLISNIAASIQTLIVLMRNEAYQNGLGASDYAGSCTGIIVFLLFGTGTEATKFLSSIKGFFLALPRQGGVSISCPAEKPHM